MVDLSIPSEFEVGVVSVRGKEGRKWLDSLPAMVRHYCRRWNLELDGHPWHGFIGLVLPVKKSQQSCVLKLSWVDEETRDEALALKLWNGNGAVQLLEANPEKGALLLERLDGDRSLQNLELFEATSIAAELLRRLSIPSPDSIPKLSSYAERQRHELPEGWRKLGAPFEEHYILQAVEIASELAVSSSDNLVNQDLHYENVLAGSREPWLVIDPKVVSGDTEFGIAPLLWNRLDEHCTHSELDRRFELLVEVAGLDLQRALSCTFLRSVDYGLWALSIGLSEDSKSCLCLMEWLLHRLRPSMSFCVILLLVLSSCSMSVAAADATLPAIPAEGTSAEDFCPRGWQILKQAGGDLNGDGKRCSAGTVPVIRCQPEPLSF